ncbi:MAG TPA: ATP-binding protein, partial [Opitutaceae bacterium]|nr:ATP-binding protein [Opitutaceae bacterium]
PVMRSFGTTDIQARGPVLSFAETNDGWFFIGSNRLSAFDGRRWQRIDIPGAYGIRALAADDSTTKSSRPERVWVGGVDALGYVELDRESVWKFVSLQPQLTDAGIAMPKEISSVYAVGSGAVFVSHQQVLRWDGSKFEVCSPQNESRLIAVSGGRNCVWFVQESVGLFVIEGTGAPRMVIPNSDLPHGSLRWILPTVGTTLDADDPIGMLLGTANAIYQITTDGYRLLPKLSALVASSVAQIAVSLDKDNIAIGTLKDGVVIGNRNDELSAIANRYSGLSEDAVNSLWSDRRGGVWIGLSDGCTRIYGRASVFDARDGLDRGLPRKVLTHEGSVYILTDKAFYRMIPKASQAEPTRLAPVISLEPQLSDAISSDDGLWVSGQDGLWRIQKQGDIRQRVISGHIGRLGLSPRAPNLVLYTDSSHSTEAPHSVEADVFLRRIPLELRETPISLITDNQGDVWVSTARDGIHRFKQNTASHGSANVLSVSSHYRESAGLPKIATHPILSSIGSHVFIFTETQVLVFDDSKNEFIPAPELSDWIGVAAAASTNGTDGVMTAYWVAKKIGLPDPSPYALIRISIPESGNMVTWEPVHARGIDALGEITSLDVTQSETGSVIWIGGKGGLLRLESDKADPVRPIRPLQIREVRLRGNHDSRLELSPDKSVKIPPGATQVTFVFSVTQPIEGEPAPSFYQTRLLGVETDWSPPQRENTREFTALAPGSYVFEARRMDRYGRVGDAVDYPFTITRSWYWRWPAMVAYVGFAGLALMEILRWRLRLLHLRTKRLDKLVHQRTRQLELSDTAKSEFLETISHELRNPLNGIVGLVNLLDPERMKSEDKSIARALKSTAEHLRRVSEDVLEFSKLEFGYVTVQEKAFSLSRTLHDVVTYHSVFAEQQGNPVTIAMPTETNDWFTGDELKIRTIISNFLNNALKYAPGQPVEIRADWALDEGPLVQVYIEVKDRGPGMPSDEQELVFEKFVRGSNAKKSGVVGSGLGLAACRSFARIMGGAVGVESEVDKGSSFYLWVPLIQTTAANSSTSNEPITVSRALTSALIIDDEEYNRIVLAGIAKEIGCVPFLASNDETAEAIARAHAIDLIFLDLELPGIKGDEIAKKLRSLPNSRDAIIIATTGNDSEVARKRCNDAGMDGFLLKPFETNEVRNLIQHLPAAPDARTHSAGTQAEPSGELSKPKIKHRMRAFELYAQGSPDRAHDALRRFIIALDHEMTVIKTALAQNSRRALADAGHRLRALSALVQAQRLNALAGRLQDQAESLDDVSVAQLTTEIETEVRQLAEQLQRVDALVVSAPAV